MPQGLLGMVMHYVWCCAHPEATRSRERDGQADAAMRIVKPEVPCVPKPVPKTRCACAPCTTSRRGPGTTTAPMLPV